MTNPYSSASDHCFWSRAMTAIAPGRIDPVTVDHVISPHHRVATMGSCFAQHMSRFLRASGFNYYVAEGPPAGLDATLAARRNYGVFSARYGNVYSVAQADQLFDRAFGRFTPLEDVWAFGEGYVDAFRPNIEPEPLASEEEVRRSAQEHLRHVRDVFGRCDWLIFTLGLTEAWRSKQDGAIYPMAPGVRGGHYDPARHEFVNFTVAEVSSQLKGLIAKLAQVNPQAKVLLTVSPVPLAATYENRHVWVSTTFSKAALRVAADEVERQFDQVVYFPSYEIITSPAAGGRYYADDLRQVTDLGVRHVMRTFSQHFLDQGSGAAAQAEPAAPANVVSMDSDVLCDEELIEKSLRTYGTAR